MTIHGEYGDVKSIECTAKPMAEIVQDGALKSGIQRATVLEDWVPANCPRVANYTSERQLGCVSCSHSLIEYPGGMIEC
jgi:hypothetical protein